MGVPVVVCLIFLASCQKHQEGTPTAGHLGALNQVQIQNPIQEVQALNFLVQAKGAMAPQWLDAGTHQVIADGMSYGSRTRPVTWANKTPPYEVQMDFVSGGVNLLHSRLSVSAPGLHYVILNGRSDGTGALGAQLNHIVVPAGQDEGIHFYDALPENFPLDVYFNRQKIADNFNFGVMDHLAFKDAITEITLVAHGKAPAFDPLSDELHFSLNEPLKASRVLMVFGLKSGQQAYGNQRETIFIYKE